MSCTNHGVHISADDVLSSAIGVTIGGDLLTFLLLRFRVEQFVVSLPVQRTVARWIDVIGWLTLMKVKALIREIAIRYVTAISFGNRNRMCDAARQFQRVLLRCRMVIDLEQPGFIEYALLNQRAASKQLVRHA